MLEAARGRRRLALSFSICALALVGCAVNPVTGSPEIVLVSPEQERQIGAEAAEQVAAQLGLVDDRRLAALVDSVGRRMARHSPRQDVSHTFQIVDIDEPNAFALPGGYIYVSRGLLALTNSEDELANVLGHEIAHVAARHAAQRQTRARGLGVVTLGGALLGTVLGAPGEVLGAPLQMLGAGLIAGYSREQEREADRIGQELAAGAGVDPRGMADFLRTLERTAQLHRDTTRRPSFFDTHPATPKRVESATARARSLEWVETPGVTANRAEYLRRLDGLLVGRNPAAGVFRGGRFLHPDLDFGLRLPEGWAAENARPAVGAISPRRDAKIVLEIQGRGGDPRRAGTAFLQQLSKRVDLEVTGHWEGWIHRLPAFRAQSVARAREGAVVLDFTWIAHRELIFRLTGAALGGLSRANQATFEAVARSFGPLEPDERDSIRENRLRLATAHGGERLEELSARSGNAWDLHGTAAANGLLEDSPLTRGRLVKVAVPQPYRPRRGAQ